jgi:hypothetical protein
MKIYTDDPKVHYITTSISPERTRDEISEILRQYDTSLIAWNWKYNPDGSLQAENVYVQFQIEEVIDGFPAKVTAKVIMPNLWDKAVKRSPDPKRRVETVNLKVSMRAMFWYIKANMENAYAMQSSRVAAFLSDMVTPNGTRFFDEMKQRLDRFSAIEDKTENPREVQIIKPKDVTHDYT